MIEKCFHFLKINLNRSWINLLFFKSSYAVAIWLFWFEKKGEFWKWGFYFLLSEAKAGSGKAAESQSKTSGGVVSEQEGKVRYISNDLGVLLVLSSWGRGGIVCLTMLPKKGCL